MKEIKFLDIWEIDLGQKGNNIAKHEQYGKRPFIVVSKTEYNQQSKTPIGFILSTSEKKKHNKFTITSNVRGVIGSFNVSQIKTLSQERFLEKVGQASEVDFKNLINLFMQEIIGADNIDIKIGDLSNSLKDFFQDR